MSTSQGTDGSLEGMLRTIVRDAVREVVHDELHSALVHSSAASTLRNATDTYLSVATAARIAAVAPGTIRAWIRAGRLKSKRAGQSSRSGSVHVDRFECSNDRRCHPTSSEPDPATEAHALIA